MIPSQVLSSEKNRSAFLAQLLTIENDFGPPPPTPPRIHPICYADRFSTHLASSHDSRPGPLPCRQDYLLQDGWYLGSFRKTLALVSLVLVHKGPRTLISAAFPDRTKTFEIIHDVRDRCWRWCQVKNKKRGAAVVPRSTAAPLQKAVSWAACLQCIEVSVAIKMV